jgi:hypothetical protein
MSGTIWEEFVVGDRVVVSLYTMGGLRRAVQQARK